MSLEYIAAGAVGLFVLLFFAFLFLVGGLVLLARLTGGRSIVAPAVDPLTDAAARLVSVVDSGRLEGAKGVIGDLARHEGEAFRANVAAGVAPKSTPPAR